METLVLAISDPMVEEVTHVLRDKFGWTDEAIKLAQARIADFTEKVHPRRAKFLIMIHVPVSVSAFRISPWSIRSVAARYTLWKSH
jgi:hypothetical protein